MDRGHVFVTLGDITHLECDAWLLPTDRNLSIVDGWYKSVPTLDERIRASDLDALKRDEHAVALEGGIEEPLMVLATVPLLGVRDESGIDHISESLQSFARAALEHVDDPRHSRSKPLLAIPNFGTGGGGGAYLKGLLAQRLLSDAADLARKHDVDVAIVLDDERAFARMQELRKRRTDWHELPGERLQVVTDLSDQAKSGKLVPFMGAGVSMSAGAPGWGELLDQLAANAGLSEEQREQLREWSELDRASFLRRRVIEMAEEQGESEEAAELGFAQQIAEAVDLPRYGLTPALLASLHTPQAITLNYDTLFETASADAGAPRMQIPQASDELPRDRWLLKLHGSVDDPRSIVLTRDDYLGYAAQREALSAIVKANLLTHHLLFVGFNLTDEHFHRIVHDVRRALPSGTLMADRATALTLVADSVAETLWHDQVQMRPMADSGKGDGRLIEIFLDVLVALATDAQSYLLDDEYETSLTQDEGQLKEALSVLRTSIDGLPTRTAGRSRVERLLRDLGARDE